MSDVLTNDDPLYEELYDVAREARDLGNLVEGDLNSGLAELRSRGPVLEGSVRSLLGLPEHSRHMHGDLPTYSALSFEAVESAFRKNGPFSSRISSHPNEDGEHLMGILELDGKEHLAYRKTLQPMFIKPRALSWWRDRWIAEIVEELIERLKTRDKAELNIELCARVPVHTITRAIGLQGDKALLFRNAVMRSQGVGNTSVEEARKNNRLVYDLLLDLIADRREAREEDIVSGLIDATLKLPDGEERPLTDREIAHNARLVMVAGGGTSWRQFGILLWALLTHRDQMEALRADRGLFDAAFEESVRWNVTATMFNRITNEDVELSGVPLKKGTVVQLWTAAANRDPTRWDRPDEFDIHRKFIPHVGFGIGQHQCLGMNVARAELGIGMNALFDAFPDLRLDPDAPAPFLTGGFEQRGMSALPVLLR